MYVAKPYLSNNIGLKRFEKIEDAVKYLEEYTGFEMAYERNRKTKEIVYDWELIGKLYKESFKG